MKVVRSSRLSYQQGNSDKVYEVDLCDVSSGTTPDEFVVNFRYGRRGRSLRESTKTPAPVTREEADKIFDSLVVSKLNKGYSDNTGAPQSSPPVSTPAPVRIAESTRFEMACRRVRTGLADIATDQLSTKQASRLLWRAGELESDEFVSPMLALLGHRDELFSYSLIWAIGRCGNSEDQSAHELIHPLTTAAPSDKIRRVALWASIKLASEPQANKIFKTIADDLPSRFTSLFSQSEHSRLIDAIDSHLSEVNQDSNNLLHQLYLLSFNNPQVRSGLLKCLAHLAPRPNVFRGVRQVYKAAEFFKDAEVFGVVALRFDLNKHFYSAPRWGDHTSIPGGNYDYVKVSEELKKPDARIAYSDKTRKYLQQRTRRNLRRLGELGRDDYIEMAMGILLAHKPEHKKEPREVKEYHWDSVTGQGITQTTHYDEYAHLNALLFITQSAGQKYKLGANSQTWKLNPQHENEPGRQELFPELWDKHPQALLTLLMQSEFDLLHGFGAGALIEQRSFFNQIKPVEVEALFAKPFDSTKKLAFEVARERYNPNQPDMRLVFVMLDSNYDEAVVQAKHWVQEQPKKYAADAEFLLWVVTAQSQDIRTWSRMLIDHTDQTTAATLLPGIFAWLVDQDIDNTNQQQFDDIEWVLLNPLKESSSVVPFEEILQLLVHPVPPVQVIAGRLTINHQKPAEEIPSNVFTHLLESDVAEVRGVGVELFASLPEEHILRQPELVKSFCVAEEASVRAGVKPAVAKLAKHHDFSQQLSRSLIDELFRTERADGIHADIQSLLTNELKESTVLCDVSLNWRLLQARSKSAQTLGAWLLDERSDKDFSVRQWAIIAHHPTLKAREWAWQRYRTSPKAIVEFANDAIRVADGPWQDSREFAFEYFQNDFPQSAWTPTLLVGLCDSVRDDVQRYGRDMLNQFFEEQHGEEYLLKLSQHPSARVQLFASNYLSRFAASNDERIYKLEHYFVTVLSAVNKNRVTKDRVTRFLIEEAKRSEQVARFAMRIFDRQSVTMAIVDHSSYLVGMRDLKLKYPNIESPLKLIEPKVIDPAAPVVEVAQQ